MVTMTLSVPPKPNASASQTQLVDISDAANSLQALRALEHFSDQLNRDPAYQGLRRVDLMTGNLVLAQGVVSKMRQLLESAGVSVGVLYSVVPQTQQAALDAGLYVKERPDLDYPLNTPGVAEDATPPEVPESLPQAFQEMARDIPAGLEASLRPTLFIRQTLRSGRVVDYEGNVVIIGDVHTGSEVVATGDIVVWGELRGIAHAGRSGDASAEIRALKIEALQLRIGEFIARRPDRRYEGATAALEGQRAAESAPIFPEVARIVDQEIQIFSARK
jgi:septum site-determining protein MinC